MSCYIHEPPILKWNIGQQCVGLQQCIQRQPRVSVMNKLGFINNSIEATEHDAVTLVECENVTMHLL